MAKQNSRLLLVKIGTGSGPIVYATICGLNTRTFTLSSGENDVTSIDCTTPGGIVWREMIDGIRQMSVAGNGFFENVTQYQLLVAAKMTGNSVVPLEITMPTVGVFTGNFYVGDMTSAGELEGAVTQDLTFTSTGAVTYVAET